MEAFRASLHSGGRHPRGHGRDEHEAGVKSGLAGGQKARRGVLPAPGCFLQVSDLFGTASVLVATGVPVLQERGSPVNAQFYVNDGPRSLPESGVSLMESLRAHVLDLEHISGDGACKVGNLSYVGILRHCSFKT